MFEAAAVGHSLVVLNGLGIGLGHWGRSGRCCAEWLLEIQVDDGDGVGAVRRRGRMRSTGKKGSRDGSSWCRVSWTV